MIDQRFEALWVFPRVDLPIAKTCGVVVAAAEPAIVQHEALDAKFGGGIGLGLKLIQAMIEVNTFPGVEGHWTGGVRRIGDEVRHHVVMERSAQPFQVPFASHVGQGALIALARCQYHFARFEQFARMHQQQPIVETSTAIT